MGKDMVEIEPGVFRFIDIVYVRASDGQYIKYTKEGEVKKK